MKITKFLALIVAAATVMVGCDKPSDDPKKPVTGGVSLTASNSTIEVNTPIQFTVTSSEGVDVTDSAVIYNKTLDFTEVENPYIPTVDGTYEFYAVVGESISPTISVTVVPTIPALPEDPQPASTSFNHRILLVDHTGNTCGYCPKMMLALKEVSETDDYHSKYYEAMSHSYAATDPAYSAAASGVSSYFGGLINGYPTLTYNFLHPRSSSYNTADIKTQIDALWKESADAAIAASSSISPAGTLVIANAVVKAAVTGEYNIAAWLLEDGIYAKQTNATAEWMHTHNNAIRQITTNEPISGLSLGTIEAGQTASLALTLPVSNGAWNKDNFKVMLIVSAKGANGKFDVANVAVCPINESITYDYK
jgi:hypothetical protein